MNLKKYAFSGVMAAIMLQPLQLYAVDFDLGGLNDARNMQEFRKLIEKQRNVSVFEKGGSLLIGGDVTFDGAFTREKRDGKNVNGKGGAEVHGADRRDYPVADYGVKMSLSLKYTDDNSYADILLKGSHHAGLDTKNYDVSSGAIPYEYSSLKPTTSGIKVEKANFGTQVFGDEMQSLCVELGRQRYYDIFDSRITFFQKFEGAVLKYANIFEGVGRFHATAASSVIANRANHYSFAGEIGLDQFMDSPFGLKYAYYKISKDGMYADGSNSKGEVANTSTYCYHDKGFNYALSHVLAHYNTTLDFMAATPAKFYAGYAYNHLAKKRSEFDNKEKPHAWYAGATFGDIKMPGQGTVDIIYQYVQAESVPEIDNVGGYYGMNQTNIPNVVTPTAGFTNFKGFAISGGYLASKEILLTAKIVLLDEVDAGFSNSSAGTGLGYEPATSKLDFKKFEAEVKYMF